LTNKRELYAVDSKGGIKYWSIEVVNLNGISTVRVENGKHGGKLIVKDKRITKGKNIGKANETTPWEQAVNQADSKWQKKIDKDYRESIEEAVDNDSILPMLAHKYADKKHLVEWPWLAQPKLDGVRCIITRDEDGFTFTSRGGKIYDALNFHIRLNLDLASIMKVGDVWDGEVYKHGWSLQRIVSATKKLNPKDTPQLQFWNYDVVDDRPFKDRYTAGGFTVGHVKSVETQTINDESEMERLHDKFVQDGFEGLILRDPEGLYAKGNRSSTLLKYKKFQDEEFEIIGTDVEAQTINGHDYNCIMFRCKIKAGAEFNVRPRGSLIYRQEMLKNRNAYIGKMLTVRFFTYTDETQGKGQKVPQFPVGITTRDYE